MASTLKRDVRLAFLTFFFFNRRQVDLWAGTVRASPAEKRVREPQQAAGDQGVSPQREAGAPSRVDCGATGCSPCSYLKTQTRELINMGPGGTVAKQLGAGRRVGVGVELLA